MLKFIAVLTLSSLFYTTFAATGTLYDVAGCNPSRAIGHCSNLAAGSCCYDPDSDGFLATSMAISGIGNTDVSILGFQFQQSVYCTAHQSQNGPACLQTGKANIFGALWKPASGVKARTLAATEPSCNSSQHLDVYYLALPGEQRKPYSIDATKQFDEAGAVNWETRSFKAEKVDLVREITAQDGNSLSEAQIVAISAISA